MNIRSIPDPLEKLALVGDSNRFERVGDDPRIERNDPMVEVDGVLSCVTYVSTPTGKMSVLKAMITTACEMNCHYCPFRAGRTEMRRVSFKPDELAQAFDKVQRAGFVDGIFLSSGIIKGGVTTQDKIIDTVEIIRQKYHYRGYVHLKIMPGAEEDQIRRAIQLADRVSINLEGPTSNKLKKLAPLKNFEIDLLQRLQWTDRIIKEDKAAAPYVKRAGIVTQFVVGAVGDTDLELLSISEQLYKQHALKRAYYSAFNPVENTPLAHLERTPAIREFRLYQASFLLRDYQWSVEEMPFKQDGFLRLDVDPKRAWADEHLREAPVEIMRAEKETLMRIPGIGPRGAQAIMRARLKGQLSDLASLRKIGVRAVARSAPYITLAGKRPPQQLHLFELSKTAQLPPDNDGLEGLTIRP